MLRTLDDITARPLPGTADADQSHLLARWKMGRVRPEQSDLQGGNRRHSAAAARDCAGNLRRNELVADGRHRRIRQPRALHRPGGGRGASRVHQTEPERRRALPHHAAGGGRPGGRALRELAEQLAHWLQARDGVAEHGRAWQAWHCRGAAARNGGWGAHIRDVHGRDHGRALRRTEEEAHGSAGAARERRGDQQHDRPRARVARRERNAFLSERNAVVRGHDGRERTALRVSCLPSRESMLFRVSRPTDDDWRSPWDPRIGAMCGCST